MATPALPALPAPTADEEAIVEEFAPQAEAHNLTLSTRYDVLNAVETGVVIAPTFHDSTTYCAKAVTIGTGTQVAATAAVTGAKLALNAIPVVGPILSGLSFLFGGLFTSHAKKAAEEQQDVCSLIPQLNQLIQQTDSDFSDGRITKAQALAQLNQGLTQYKQGFSGITIKSNFAGYSVNRPGDVELQYEAIVEYRDKVKYNVFEIPFWARIAIVIAIFVFGSFWLVRKIRK
jgi:hypothetical protein